MLSTNRQFAFLDNTQLHLAHVTVEFVTAVLTLQIFFCDLTYLIGMFPINLQLKDSACVIPTFFFPVSVCLCCKS